MATEHEYLALADACLATHQLAIETGQPKIIAASEAMLFVVGKMLATRMHKEKIKLDIGTVLHS